MWTRTLAQSSLGSSFQSAIVATVRARTTQYKGMILMNRLR